MNVKLVEVVRDNFNDVIELELEKAQVKVGPDTVLKIKRNLP